MPDECSLAPVPCRFGPTGSRDWAQRFAVRPAGRRSTGMPTQQNARNAECSTGSSWNSGPRLDSGGCTQTRAGGLLRPRRPGVRGHASARRARLYRWLLAEKFRRSVSAIEEMLEGARILTVCGGSGMDAEFLARAGASVVSGSRSRLWWRMSSVCRSPTGHSTSSTCTTASTILIGRSPVSMRWRALPAAPCRSNEPVRAAATRLAVRLGISYDVEDAGNRVERIDPEELAAALRADGFSVVQLERYAMYYRHEPGAVLRVLSTEPFFTAVRMSLGLFNGAVSSARPALSDAIQGDRRRWWLPGLSMRKE